MVGLDEGVRRPWLGDSGTLTDCPELGMSSIGMQVRYLSVKFTETRTMFNTIQQ